MQTSVKERLVAYLKSQKISQKAFEQQIGVSNGYVNNIRVSIQPDKIQRIAKCHPNLNIGWLLSGEGSMMKENEANLAETITIPRNVFEKISQLIETVSSQQETIADQHRTIDRLISSQHSIPNARPDDIAGCAVAK